MDDTRRDLLEKLGGNRGAKRVKDTKTPPDPASPDVLVRTRSDGSYKEEFPFRIDTLGQSRNYRDWQAIQAEVLATGDHVDSTD